MENNVQVIKGLFLTPMGQKNSLEDKRSRSLMNEINSAFADRHINAKLMRIDDIHHRGNILNNIITEIRKSNFVIADLTNQNANVYYELGFAKGTNTADICICEENNYRLASDVGGDYTIPYNIDNATSKLEFYRSVIGAFKEINFDPNVHSMAELYYTTAEVINTKESKD